MELRQINRIGRCFQVIKLSADVRVFCSGIGIVRHQLNRTFSCKHGKRGQVFARIGDPGNQGNPDHMRFAALLEMCQIAVNRRVGYPGIPAVRFIVGEFEIKQDIVHCRKDAQKCFLRRKTGGLQGDPNAVFMQTFGKCRGKLRLQKRLSSRQRNTAVLTEQRRGRCELFRQRAGCDLFSGNGDQTLGADVQTASVWAAVVMRTRTAADTAMIAHRLSDCQCRTGIHALGIMAPDAGQRTAFEKHGRPHARTVMDGEFLYVKDHAFDRVCIVIH